MAGSKDFKIDVLMFVAKEQFKGLGYGYEVWCQNLKRKIRFSENTSGKRWLEEAKIYKFGSCMQELAFQQFNNQPSQEVGGRWILGKKNT